MTSARTHIPNICISPAPPEEPLVEPFSPFSSAPVTSGGDEDAFRPRHLTPPPAHANFKPLSPLRPADHKTPAKGLERERFEALLQASRERNSALGVKKEGGLRKEITLKAHKNKHCERRALFLSKVLAPPSPTATLTPKTPPDSPAIFYYSLPSPGLDSPLAHFESLNNSPAHGPLTNPCEPWIERVDFRTPESKCTKKTKVALRVLRDDRTGNILPSLEQISARLKLQGYVRPHVSSGNTINRPATLPPFLPRPGRTPPERLPITVGRLQIPVRARKPPFETLCLGPPNAPVSPKFKTAACIAPRSDTKFPTEKHESHLNNLNTRQRKAQDMLFTLRRRTLTSENVQTLPDATTKDEVKIKWKRHSAPANLSHLAQRAGFEHPVLSVPGGF